MTKAVKTGLHHRNDNLRTKTDEINENTNRRQVDPIQTSFIRQLQDINNTKLNTTLPDKEELRSVKLSKNDKSTKDVLLAYVKYTTECKEFTL